MGWNLKKKFKKSKIGKSLSGANEWARFSHDPGGLFIQSKDERFAGYQSTLDFGGYGAKPAQEAAAAEKAAGEQKAAISKQEALIEKERKKQQAVIDERAARMSKNQLLSGKETGIPGRTSLLGRR